MNTQTLKLSQIRIDGGTQPRVEISQEVVADYADQLRGGVEFPPVMVFFDGVAYWLADGFHRYHAHRSAGQDTIIADIQDGGLREAILYSVGANSEHGLRRTNEDKRRAVETMLTNEIASKDENGNPWPNREIARKCKTSEFLVRRTRDALSAIKSQIDSPKRTVKRGNSTYTQNTAKIGKGKSKPKKIGELARNAFKPVRSARPALAQTPIDLPHDPYYAAQAIVHAMGKEFTLKLIDALTNRLKGIES